VVGPRKNEKVNGVKGEGSWEEKGSGTLSNLAVLKTNLTLFSLNRNFCLSPCDVECLLTVMQSHCVLRYRKCWRRSRGHQLGEWMVQSRNATCCLYSAMATKLIRMVIPYQSQSLEPMENTSLRDRSGMSCQTSIVPIWKEFQKFCSSAVAEEVCKVLFLILFFLLSLGFCREELVPKNWCGWYLSEWAAYYVSIWFAILCTEFFSHCSVTSN